MDLSTQEMKLYASAFELCGISFGYPTEMLAQVMASGEWAEAAKDIAGGLGIAEDFDLEAEATDGKSGDVQDALHRLRAEYTRLFIGAPKSLVPPYESLWIGDQDEETLLFVNPCALGMEAFAKHCGLKRAEGAAREPFDSVMIEMQLAEYLLACLSEEVDPTAVGIDPTILPGGSFEAALMELVNDHLRVWIPRFAEAVEGESHLSLYRYAARFMESVVEGIRTKLLE